MNTKDKAKSSSALLIHAAAQAAGRGERQVHPLNGNRQAIGGMVALLVRIFRRTEPKVPSAGQAAGTNQPRLNVAGASARGGAAALPRRARGDQAGFKRGSSGVAAGFKRGSLEPRGTTPHGEPPPLPAEKGGLHHG